jgi:hypothetical protein
LGIEQAFADEDTSPIVHDVVMCIVDNFEPQKLSQVIENLPGHKNVVRCVDGYSKGNCSTDFDFLQRGYSAFHSSRKYLPYLHARWKFAVSKFTVNSDAELKDILAIFNGAERTVFVSDIARYILYGFEYVSASNLESVEAAQRIFYEYAFSYMAQPVCFVTNDHVKYNE